ncbi:unnamed protein product [Angiostrongylus costaricensis]|uniref:Nudix hydrolase domain-containing protein n=1 Tax=Angiostrongylus costaricensis TaxID=334426 RepID=A0A158PJ97_ANGCS|nr:unnamed protein product [Angiostrongylus costaricensis]
MGEQECDRLRSLLRLSFEPTMPDGRKDAGVLILLDGTPNDYSVFLCVRSQELRRHPGEVCFPGGMRENSENMQETAIREAEEEVGLKPEDFVLLGSLPSFLTRSGILIHPSVTLLRRPFLPQLNVSEVQRTFWISLERFLDDSSHTSFDVVHNYTVHSFMVLLFATSPERAGMSNITSKKIFGRKGTVNNPNLRSSSETWHVNRFFCHLCNNCFEILVHDFMFSPLRIAY